MNREKVGIAFEIAAPYETALKLIRDALLNEGLHISREFDVLDGTRQRRGTNLVARRILCVDCPLLLLEAVVLDPSSAVFFPLHIVISENGLTTSVSWLNPASYQGKRLPVGVMLPLRALDARIARAMEKTPVATGSPVEVSCAD